MAFVVLAVSATGLQLTATNHPRSNAQTITISPSAGPSGPTGPAGSSCTSAQNCQARVVTTATDGTITWTYPVAYGAGVVPVIEAISQATAGSTDVINVQLDGAPTNTQAKLRVTRTQQSVVALIGLTVLSVPASVGATNVHVTARTPS